MIDLFSPAVILISMFLIFIIMITKGFFILRQQEVMIIERFGRYTRTLYPGINLILPFIDKPRPIMIIERIKSLNGKITTKYIPSKVISLRETVYDIPCLTVSAYDNTDLKVNILVSFQIVEPKKAVYQVENLPASLDTLVKIEFNNIAKNHTQYDICAANEELKTILREKTAKWGIEINNIEIQNCKDYI